MLMFVPSLPRYHNVLNYFVVMFIFAGFLGTLTILITIRLCDLIVISLIFFSFFYVRDRAQHYVGSFSKS